jgi:branched-subunit amino acid aminotransferase/4-amino-4-deoxychorismate lyase
MFSWIWRDGAFVSCDSLPLSDRGFRYGMAVFESIRVWKAVPLFWQEHLDRLRLACEDRQFTLDRNCFEAAEQILRQHEEDGFARLYITAGDGGITDPADQCRTLLLLEPRARPTVQSYHLAMPQESHQPLFGGLKTANYWAQVDALQRALGRGRDEALLFNEHAELVSACMGNVFLVHDGQVCTPALACGARDGVVREWVLHQVEVKQRSFFVEDVERADEVFICNSWIGIMSVHAIDRRPLPSTTFATRLRAAFEDALLAQLP